MDVIRIDEATVTSMAGEVPAVVEERHRDRAREFLARWHPTATEEAVAALARELAEAEAGDVMLEVRHLNGVATRAAYPGGLRVALHGSRQIGKFWQHGVTYSGKVGPGRGVHGL